MFCCACCKKESNGVKLPRHLEKPLATPNNDSGCFLVCLENNLYFCWSVEEPSEGVIALAKPEISVPPGRYTNTLNYISTPGKELQFLKGVLQFIREAGPSLPQVTINPSANERSLIPFILLFHFGGNEIIGGRVSKVSPGEGVGYISGVDCVAAVPQSANLPTFVNVSVQDFIKIVDQNGGTSILLDPLGKEVPANI